MATQLTHNYSLIEKFLKKKVDYVMPLMKISEQRRIKVLEAQINRCTSAIEMHKLILNEVNQFLMG